MDRLSYLKVGRKLSKRSVRLWKLVHSLEHLVIVFHTNECVLVESDKLAICLNLGELAYKGLLNILFFLAYLTLEDKSGVALRF